MERNREWYYILLDPIGSPAVVFNSIGSVVKQTIYDPLGGVLTTSSDNFAFGFGFQGGIQDRDTKMVFLNNRAYDPTTGRWATPDYKHFMDKVSTVWENPELTNHYLYKGIINRVHVKEINLMTGKR